MRIVVCCVSIQARDTLILLLTSRTIRHERRARRRPSVTQSACQWFNQQQHCQARHGTSLGPPPSSTSSSSTWRTPTSHSRAGRSDPRLVEGEGAQVALARQDGQAIFRRAGLVSWRGARLLSGRQDARCTATYRNQRRTRLSSTLSLLRSTPIEIVGLGMWPHHYVGLPVCELP